MRSINPSGENSINRYVLTMPRFEAKNLLEAGLNKGKSINNADDIRIWLAYVRELLRRIIDTDDLVEQFNTQYYVTEGFESDISIRVNEASVILRSILGKLELIPESVGGSGMRKLDSLSGGDKVFIVHGHNSGIRETVARFIERLGIKPIILGEQPNQGRTIIEKFLEYSDVSFAIVLLTGDDRGGVKNGSYENQKLRARQNVIFELGFFIGKLGRDNVCALYEDGVEIPSDYQGVLFLPVDKSEMWKLLLAKEMKAAHLPIDLNMIN